MTAWWEASTTGDEAAFERRKQFQNQLVELYSNKEVFAKLRPLKATNQVKDPVLNRELDVMYRTHGPAQGDPVIQKKIIELEGEVEQIFNAHRGEMDGKPTSENEIREILSTSADSVQVEKAWKAYMQVGAKVEAQLKELGITLTDWARLPADPRSDILQSADEAGPKEYRELIRRYFEELAKRGGPAEKVAPK